MRLVDVTLAALRAAIGRLGPHCEARVPDSRKAAVAAVLRDGDGSVELLFIHRASDPRDPWSGHMGFPGGRVDAEDAGPLAAALRESREELGLDLEREARLIGPLSEVRTHLRPGGVPRAVAPFAFELVGNPVLVPNREVEEALWVPFSLFLDPGNRRSMTWVRRGVPLPLPCYHWDGKVIWGLTLRIVDELLAAVGSVPEPWPLPLSRPGR
jgi:8-oxo-dGTP pyrophosphatase MutT (NUDIX family)